MRFIINGGFITTESITDILKEENGLEGCMAGRLAMYTPWEISKVDREFYGETKDSMNREDILLDYADFA